MVEFTSEQMKTQEEAIKSALIRLTEIVTEIKVRQNYALRDILENGAGATAEQIGVGSSALNRKCVTHYEILASCPHNGVPGPKVGTAAKPIRKS